MTTPLITQDLTTTEITMMSNVTSMTVVGTKVSRVGDKIAHQQGSLPAIHIDFYVKQPQHRPVVFEATESVGMILSLTDAVKLGTLLVALGLANKTSDDITAAMALLKQSIQDFS